MVSRVLVCVLAALIVAVAAIVFGVTSGPSGRQAPTLAPDSGDAESPNTGLPEPGKPVEPQPGIAPLPPSAEGQSLPVGGNSLETGDWARSLTEEQARALACVVEGETAVVSGQVRSADGRGVPNAPVVALQERQLRTNPEFLEEGESSTLPFAALKEVGQALTDGTGRYSLALPRANTTVRLGSILQYEAAPPAERTVVPPASEVDLLVTQRTRVHLRLFDSLSGAVVRDSHPTILNRERSEVGWTVYLAPGTHRFEVYAPTHVSRCVSVTVASDSATPQTVRVELVPAITVRGTVVNSHGNPEPFVALYAEPLDGAAAPDLPRAFFTAGTDQRGEFVLSRIPRARYRVFILMPLDRGQSSEIEIDAAGDLTDQVFAVPHGDPERAGRYHWADRRNLAIEFPSDAAFHQVNARQCVSWLSALAGVQGQIGSEAERTLEQTSVSCSDVSGRTLEDNLKLIAGRAGLEFTAHPEGFRLATR